MRELTEEENDWYQSILKTLELDDTDNHQRLFLSAFLSGGLTSMDGVSEILKTGSTGKMI